MQEPLEGLKGDGRDIVLDAFGIGFGGLGRHPDRGQQVHHEPMARPYRSAISMPASVRNTAR